MNIVDTFHSLLICILMWLKIPVLAASDLWILIHSLLAREAEWACIWLMAIVGLSQDSYHCQSWLAQHITHQPSDNVKVVPMHSFTHKILLKVLVFTMLRVDCSPGKKWTKIMCKTSVFNQIWENNFPVSIVSDSGWWSVWWCREGRLTLLSTLVAETRKKILKINYASKTGDQ